MHALVLTKTRSNRHDFDKTEACIDWYIRVKISLLLEDNGGSGREKLRTFRESSTSIIKDQQT